MRKGTNVRKVIYSETRRADLAEKILLKILKWNTIPKDLKPGYAIEMADLLIKELNKDAK